MKTKSGNKSKKAIILHVLLRIFAVIIAAAVIIAGLTAAMNLAGNKSNETFIGTIPAVEYENQLVPSADENGCYTFVTDREFRIMQLTDIHIGAGFMSKSKDKMALNAVAAMILQEKPDLVVVTGDITYAVPFQAGTFNNMPGVKLFAGLMEQLGVYWAPVFGNHDSESYSYYSRESVAKAYAGKEYPHCLIDYYNSDITGVTNYIINVKNTSGKTTQSLFLFDSNSYVDSSLISIVAWDYDCIHKDQIDWYTSEFQRIQAENGGEMPKSLAFFHIPPIEVRNAWNEFCQNGYENTDDIKYFYGKSGEPDKVIYSSELNEGFFDALIQNGSTQGLFFGHDHVNNFSLSYKDIRCTYGYSIDYLAYSGISGYGTQRGCTMISVAPDGSFECHGENYYQDKYSPVFEKENVVMEDYHPEAVSGPAE